MSAVGSAEFEMAAEKQRMAASAASPAVPQTRPVQNLSPSALLSLQQMGFAPSAIQQATTMLGQNSSFEELFDVLLAMGAPLSPPNSGTAASSTDAVPVARAAAWVKPTVVAAPTEPAEDADLDYVSSAAAALVVEMVQEELGTLDQDASNSQSDEVVLDAEPDSPSLSDDVVAAVVVDEGEPESKVDEVPVRELAIAVVASAVARAVAKLPPVASQEEAAAQPKHLVEGSLAASPVRGGA